MEFLKTFAPVAVLFASFFQPAQGSEYTELLNRLNTLLKSKDYLGAHQLADLNIYEFGGEPEFDLLAGFAAYGGENYQEAVFAFERVIVSKPGSFLGRYYLALCYYKVDNLHAAILELEKLQLRPLTQNQIDKTDSLLRRVNRELINRNLSWYSMLSASVAYDSNINSGTDEESIEIVLGGAPIDFLLSPESQATQDLSYAFSYLAGYQHPLTQSQWVKLDISANYRTYGRNTQLQRQQLGVNFSYEQELLRGKFSVAGFSRPMWLEQEVDPTSGSSTALEREHGLYRTENGTSLFFQKNTSRKTSYRAGLSYSLLNNEQSDNLDSMRTKVSAAFQYKTSLLHTLMGHYQRDVSEESLAEHNDSNSVGITYQLTWPIAHNVVNNSYLSVESYEYGAPHPIFNKTRNDTLAAFSSQLLFNSSDKLQLKLQLNVQHRESNIDLFSYDRFEISGTWQYRF